MGLLGNIFASMIVRENNRKRNHLNRRHIDFISTDTNLILCGGRRGRESNRGEYILSRAEELKLETFFVAAEKAEQKNQGAVCFFAEDYFPNTDITQVRLTSEYVYFGNNARYNPLNTCEMNVRSVYEFFKRIVNSYCQKKLEERYSTTICGVIRMLLTIISENMGDNYITLDNLVILANSLCKNQIEFQNDILRFTGRPFLKEWENYLTLSWDDASRKFFEFWQEFCESIHYYNRTGVMTEESLYTVLLERKVCFCGISLEQSLLRDILLSELEMIHREMMQYGKYKFIDYYVPLKNENLRCITNSECCMIGDSFSSLEILQIPFQNPTVICLGVNSKDATDIFETMVYSGSWTRTNFGFSPFGSNVTFTDAERKAITESDLSFQNIQDGSAFRISERGYTYIRSLF